MKIAALIGEPCSGKTTIARELLTMISRGELFKIGTLCGTLHLKEHLYVLGTYSDGDVFSGTDKLSMAVQPDAEAFLEETKTLNPKWNIFFEGDRLGNKSFFKICENISDAFQIYVAVTGKHTKSIRHHARHDTQSERFLKGRETKISNIRTEFTHSVSLENNSISDLRPNASAIFSFLFP